MSLLRTIQGSLHQGSSVFVHGGSQCTSIAFFALALFYSYDFTCNFSSVDIDNIYFISRRRPLWQYNERFGTE